jgi:hypothetical protein
VVTACLHEFLKYFISTQLNNSMFMSLSAYRSSPFIVLRGNGICFNRSYVGYKDMMAPCVTGVAFILRGEYQPTAL